MHSVHRTRSAHAVAWREYDEPMAFFARVVAHGWLELVKHLEQLGGGGWAFRGQSDATWRVQTSLERALNGRAQPWAEERRALDMFKRRVGLYGQRVDRHTTWLEASSLLRHHGGPSRLLDVSASRWVAAYFALENMNEKNGCAIWAFQPSDFAVRTTKDWSSTKTVNPPTPEEALEESIEGDERHLAGVLHVQPWSMNERVAAQQGSFLAPVNIEFGFERNLISVAADDDETARSKHHLDDVSPLDEIADDGRIGVSVVKITVPNVDRVRFAGLRSLREMNITAASLYPGLDGFARSISVRINSGDA